MPPVMPRRHLALALSVRALLVSAALGLPRRRVPIAT
jgi:hypothetical protein